MRIYIIYTYICIYIYIIQTAHGQEEVCDTYIAYVSIRQHTSATSASVAYHIYSEDTHLLVCGHIYIAVCGHIYCSMRTHIWGKRRSAAVCRHIFSSMRQAQVFFFVTFVAHTRMGVKAHETKNLRPLQMQRSLYV